MRCPVMAQFLEDVAREFGRPEDIRVVLRDWKVTIKRGG